MAQSSSSSSAVSTATGKKVIEIASNPRGIPGAPFVSNVDEFVGGQTADIESIIKAFEETSAKYRYMEVNLQQKRKALESKIPDINQTLEVVKFLQSRQEEKAKESEPPAEDEDDLEDEEDKKPQAPLRTLYELNDTLYSEASIDEDGNVGLWLGANTMLLYPLQEADALLSSKLETARQNLKNTIEDLEFLREQVVVMQVNFARVHNWDVKRRRDQKLLDANQPGAGAVKSLKEEEEEEEDDR